jgi:NAD(P)-dependent dehydrogenase (short-subunit alcohol dehydrogenase family)
MHDPDAKTILITGASDGVGAAAARALHGRGHTVIVVGRDPEKTGAVAEPLGAPWLTADFARLDDVRHLAETVIERWPALDVLASNAGGLMGAKTTTIDGHELTFQVDHLAPFLLTRLLLPRLIENRGTIIATSSVAHRVARRADLTDPDHPARYGAERAYALAKLANILHVKELHRRYHADGIATAAFHPGVVASGFSAGSRSPLKLLYRSVLNRLIRSPEQGADTLIWLASSRGGADWPSGAYFTDRGLATTSKLADDPEAAARLWGLSERMLGD